MQCYEYCHVKLIYIFVHIKNSWYGVAAFIIFSNSSKVRPRGIHNLNFFFINLKVINEKGILYIRCLTFLNLFIFFFYNGWLWKKNLLPSNVDTRSVSCAVQEKKGGGVRNLHGKLKKKKQSKKCLEHVWLNINDSLSLNCWLLFNILPIVI